MIDHGFTPSIGNPFSDETTCRVMLARYPCQRGREEHDPTLPPEDVDAFGYRRRAGDIPVWRYEPEPECEHIATVTTPIYFTYGPYVGTTDPVTICVTCHAHVTTEGA